jgi:hypothetical protein
MKDVAKIEADMQVLMQDLMVMDFSDPNFSETMAAVSELKKELDAERTRIGDVNAAKYLLSRHGYAFKIFGPEDVERHLLSMEDNDGGGREIAKIVDHVVNGDDWQTMADVTDADEANIWALIEGTRGDHPEWFGPEE